MSRISDEQRIDLAAQAIQRVVCNRSGKGKDWEKLPPLVRDQFREEARQALVAAGAIEA